MVLFVVVKTIEDNSLCHPRFHRANTTDHAWLYGLVLQVRAYCAQYNICKTTANSSTIGKKTTPFVIRNFTRHAQPTLVHSTAGTYGRIGASI